ncbi:MAG TPA: hypothetical protein VFW12_03515 [Candidatus Limnocylindria bacterium]|nr:hypothetical protein [Candidatus Limnocylindria bacterium]
MSDVVREFEQHFLDGGTRYRARVVAAPHKGTTWQGWIEFIPVGEGTPCRTDRETVQPDRAAVVYWAEGLEPLYLDGAFERACRGANATTTPARSAR